MKQLFQAITSHYSSSRFQLSWPEAAEYWDRRSSDFKSMKKQYEECRNEFYVTRIDSDFQKMRNRLEHLERCMSHCALL